MKEFDFEQLKNIEIEFPDSWVENALNSPEEKRRYVIPQRFYYIAASAAAFVIIAAAVTLSMILGIGKDVDLIEPNPDPSQADIVSGGTSPAETEGTEATPETPPVYTDGQVQSPTAVIEPSENSGNSGNNGNSKNDDTKSTRQRSASANGSTKPSPKNSKKPNNSSSSEQGATDPDNSEDQTAAPATEEPWLPPPWEEPTEEWKPYEPATDEPWLEPPTSLLPEYREREFHFSIYAKLASADDVVYCKVTDKDGNVVSSGSANLEFYDSVYSLLSYTTCLKASIDDPFKVCFYRADGGVYTTQTIKTRAINNFDLGYCIRAKY